MQAPLAVDGAEPAQRQGRTRRRYTACKGVASVSFFGFQRVVGCSAVAFKSDNNAAKVAAYHPFIYQVHSRTP